MLFKVFDHLFTLPVFSNNCYQGFLRALVTPNIPKILPWREVILEGNFAPGGFKVKRVGLITYYSFTQAEKICDFYKRRGTKWD